MGALLQLGLQAGNLQPSLSTTINRLISSELEKDILMFARPTVACPKPWAGASAAGGAGGAPSQEYPVPCSVFLHTTTDSSSLAPSPSCRVHIDTALALPSPVPSNPPDGLGMGVGIPTFGACSLPTTAPVMPSTGSLEKHRPQVLLPGRDEEGKAWGAGGCQLLDQPLKIWPLTGWS